MKHFLVTAFSRNALLLLIKAYGWEQPAEIIIPAFTCPVIKHTVEAANVKAVPVDAEPNGLNIDPEAIKEAITPNTKAIYVVHTYGTPVQIEKICAIAREHDLIVIEDLAHTLFTTYKGHQLGTFGDFAILSFTKQIIDFEGGAVATNNTEIYNKMLQLREEYQQPGSFSFGGLIDSYVRIVGSWWESGFSLPALVMMKFHDRLNRLIYKGSYGISIDYSKFYASSLGSWLVLVQLDKLYKKKMKLDFVENSGVLNQAVGKPRFRSPYNVGMAILGSDHEKLLSFRTWHNANEPGHYPRADRLHDNLRIFSKMKSLFGKQQKAVPKDSILDI